MGEQSLSLILAKFLLIWFFVNFFGLKFEKSSDMVKKEENLYLTSLQPISP